MLRRLEFTVKIQRWKQRSDQEHIARIAWYRNLQVHRTHRRQCRYEEASIRLHTGSDLGPAVRSVPPSATLVLPAAAAPFPRHREKSLTHETFPKDFPFNPTTVEVEPSIVSLKNTESDLFQNRNWVPSGTGLGSDPAVAGLS